ncbi:hypothetical protein Desti_4821 [Desulfomonile tiedjei DSM 6799]|uniref:Uncharacterized protein n=1 Tax=Desulfomonile tiedjei (strain ATCC 49306 / DSM 6799 / DCB-1) TaxID=706587 RepID=I4CCZ6_DESTA|nr:hypothetical protein Desti_4821 [Desulfomonile tiedjei DSM 6799]
MGAGLRAGHIFNIINDMYKMGWQVEIVSKVEICLRSWHEVLIVLMG